MVTIVLTQEESEAFECVIEEYMDVLQKMIDHQLEIESQCGGRVDLMYAQASLSNCRLLLVRLAEGQVEEEHFKH